LVTHDEVAERRAAVQMLLALVALPAVALLLALASRLEDSLRAAAVPVRATDDLDQLADAEPQPSVASPGG
jgi:hypothetical protein